MSDGNPQGRRPPNLTLRPGTAGDRLFVGELSGRVFGALGRYDRIVPIWLVDASVQTMIAEAAGTPVGFAMIRSRRGLGRLSTPVAELVAIAVAPEHQHRGIGRALLTAVEARMHPRTRAILLNTPQDNISGQRFFSAAGFVAGRTRDRFYPAGQGAIDMRKSLPARRND